MIYLDKVQNFIILFSKINYFILSLQEKLTFLLFIQQILIIYTYKSPKYNTNALNLSFFYQTPSFFLTQIKNKKEQFQKLDCPTFFDIIYSLTISNSFA